ncbi:MAG TPA: hypothetical protein VIE44_10325 [Methylomirabilota bacterium]|jgi:hypothetical protein
MREPPTANEGPDITQGQDLRPPDGYEPPRVERLLSPADLEREILYAGVDVPSVPE